MAGKARPSLRAKTLANVERSNLSNTDKECIRVVFKRAEVKHGEWALETDEEMPNPMFKLVVCSVCNGKANGTYHYCPHCGAKMDGTPKERGGEK
jgi:hypothetical protein